MDFSHFGGYSPAFCAIAAEEELPLIILDDAPGHPSLSCWVEKAPITFVG